MSHCTSFLPPPHQGLLCVSSCSPMRSIDERMKHYKQASVTSPSHRVVLPVPPPPNTATLSCSHFPLHSSTLWWTTAIASSHPDQHCLRSLNLCTTRKSFGTKWFPLLNLQDWIVIVTTKNINFPNGKSWVTLPDAIEGSPKPGFGVQSSILEDTMLEYLYSDAIEGLTWTFPEAGISIHLLQNQLPLEVARWIFRGPEHPNSLRGYKTNLMSKALQDSSNFKYINSQPLA